MSARPLSACSIMPLLACAALLAALAAPLDAEEPPPPPPPPNDATSMAVPAPSPVAPLYNPPIEPAVIGGGSLNLSFGGSAGGHGHGHGTSGGGHHMHGSGGHAGVVAALIALVVLGTLAFNATAQEPPPPPPPPPPAATLPPITVPAPPPAALAPVTGPATNPAPWLNPFAELLPPPAGPALVDTPKATADFWAITQEHLSHTPSNFTQSQLTLAYDFRYPLGPFTLGARPQFDVMFLSGPTPPGPDLPPQAYGLSVAFEGEFRVDPRFSIRAQVQPGIFTDFDHVSGNAFRVPAQVTGAYGLSSDLILVGGVMYTAQPSLAVLPVVGVVWVPAPPWRLQLMFPQTRAIYHVEDGLNVYGVLGLQGQTYSMRVDGVSDLFQYRDVRLGFGAEWATPIRLHLFLEAGLAFWRRIDLSNQGNSNVNPGLYIRAGGRF